jgi:hypothetical protein
MSADDAKDKYVEELLKVNFQVLLIFSISRLYASKILERVDDETSKKYIAEIEAA